MRFLLLFIPFILQAHMIDKKFGDFYGGMLHPLTALDNILPIITLSLLIITQKWTILSSQKELIIFWLSLLIGALSALFFKLPYIYHLNLSSLIIFGLLLALNRKLPTILFWIIISIFGFTHGFSNGELINKSRVIFYYFIPGVLISITIVMLYIVGIGDLLLKQKKEWIEIAIRVIGSWMMTIGILVLALTIRNWELEHRAESEEPLNPYLL